MTLEDELRRGLAGHLDRVDAEVDPASLEPRVRRQRRRRIYGQAGAGMAAALVGVVAASVIFGPADDPTFVTTGDAYEIALSAAVSDDAPFEVSVEPSSLTVEEGDTGQFEVVFTSAQTVVLDDVRWTHVNSTTSRSANFATAGHGCGWSDGIACDLDLRLLVIEAGGKLREPVTVYPGTAAVSDQEGTGTFSFDERIRWWSFDAKSTALDRMNARDGKPDGVAVVTMNYVSTKDQKNSESDTPLRPGLHVQLLAPEEVVAGELFDVTVVIEDDEGAFSGMELVTGDGRTIGSLARRDCSGHSTAEETRYEETFQHALRAEGFFMLEVVAGTGGCYTGKYETKRVNTTVHASFAEVPSNGPLTPSAQIGHEYIKEDPGLLFLDFGVSDEDGFVTSMTFDWGDGSEPLVIEEPLDNCQTSPTQWHRTAHSRQVSHRYETEGLYTTSLVVQSVDCEGGTQQQATDTRVVSFPPPPGGGGYEPD